MRVQRNWRRVEHGCRGARMADYRAVDLSYGPRSSAGITSVEDQSIDIKERSSIQQIHSGPPASDGPGTRSGVDGSNRVVNARGGNYAGDAVPATDRRIVQIVGKCGSSTQREGKQYGKNLLHFFVP